MSGQQSDITWAEGRWERKGGRYVVIGRAAGFTDARTEFWMAWGKSGEKPDGSKFGSREEAQSWAVVLDIGGFEKTDEVGILREGERIASDDELAAEAERLSAWLGEETGGAKL